MQPKDRRVDANLAGGGNIVLLVVQEQQSGRQVCRLVCFAFFTFLVAIIGALIVAGRLFGLSKAPQSPSCYTPHPLRTVALWIARTALRDCRLYPQHYC